MISCNLEFVYAKCFYCLFGGGGEKKEGREDMFILSGDATELSRVAANVFLLCFNVINLVN